MPIYEFFCPDNRRIYSFFARSLRYAGKTPRCPENPKFRMERMVSKFAVTGRAKETPSTPDSSPQEDARMESAMREMERDFGGMDSDNPDPRQLARMMRKMSALTGDATPPQMEELIRRMEAGEDPEKLENEFGDLMDDATGMDGAGMPNEKGKGGRRQIRRRITCDPVLYEISEFIEMD
jgi:hypothetical protein